MPQIAPRDSALTLLPTGGGGGGIFIPHHQTICSTLKPLKVTGIRPLSPVQNSVSLKLMQRKTFNFVINLPDVENIAK